MDRQLTDVARMIAERATIKALYLCGSFDDEGNPTSPDIHLLGITSGRMVADLHYLPGVSAVRRRVEVSLVGEDLLKDSLGWGVKTWLGFYTLEKLRSGKPIVENDDFGHFRKQLIADWKPALSFQARALRRLREALRSMTADHVLPTDQVLRSNTVILDALTLLAIVGRMPFTRLSELVLTAKQSGTLGYEQVPAQQPKEMLDRCGRLIQSIIKRLGYDAGRIASGSTCDHP